MSRSITEDSLLLNDSNSQPCDDSVVDIDQLLKPLSVSQQLVEDELNSKDQKIKEELATQQEQIKTEHEEVVNNHKVFPTLLRKRPPGLDVFNYEQPLIFSPHSLSLEADFGWGGRARVVGVLPQLDTVLGDPLLLSRYLAAGTGQSGLISCQDEYRAMVEFLFHRATATQCRKEFALTSRALLDLLMNWGFSWSVTPAHLLAPLLNLGCSPGLLGCAEVEAPEWLAQPRPVTPGPGPGRETRLLLLRNTLQLLAELLQLPDRATALQADQGRPVVSMLFLALLAAQDTQLVRRPAVNRHLTTLQHSLADQLVLQHPADAETRLQDLAEQWAQFHPRQLCEASTAGWSYEGLPVHLEQLQLNHPHNMLHLTNTVPLALAGLKQIIAYLHIQLIIGMPDIDLPGEVSVKDVLKIFSDRKRILQEFSKNHAYCLWIIFKLTDSIVSLDLEELRVGTEKFEAMKELLGILEKYRNKLRLNDPLDLDPNMAGELTGEIIIRWKMCINIAENLFTWKNPTNTHG